RARARERPVPGRAQRRPVCCVGSGATRDAPDRSFELEPSVDAPDLAGDVARLVAAEKRDDVRHLAGRARAPQENTPPHLFRGKGADLFAHLRLDDAGSKGVDADPTRGELDGERAREGFHTAFRSGVIALAAPGDGFDLADQGAGRVLGTEVADADRHAAPGERQRSRRADSSRGPSHQRDGHATSRRTALARPGVPDESSSALRPGAARGAVTGASGPPATRLRPAIGGIERRRSSSIQAATCATGAAAPNLPNAAADAVRRAPEPTSVETSRRSSSSRARTAHAAPSTTRSARETREATSAAAQA